MKKENKFQIPEAEIVLLCNEDIITASDVDGGYDDSIIKPFPFE